LITRKYIEDIVKKGLVNDIFKAEQAYELVKAIGLKSEEMKSGQLKSYDELFGAIQYAFQTEALLSVAKVYDSPSKKYPTRCLRGVLKYLSEHTHELPDIRDPFQLSKHLRFMNAPNILIDSISTNSSDFANKFSTYIENILNQPTRLDAIQKLKLIRDKSICHNESRDFKILGPTWISLKDLIDIAKNVVGVLGWSYFNTAMAYVINGEYLLTSDASQTSYELKELFTNITKNKNE
jgi:hypothetical protein